MTAFAKWTMAGEALFGDVSARQGALEQRQQLCTGAGAWRPQTLKTNINALALMYKQTAPPTGIVPSVDKQFPKFCRFFNAASTRGRNNPAREPVMAVLRDHEVEALFDKTN